MKAPYGAGSAGMISGKLLEAYCPDNGQCDSQHQAPSGRRLLSSLTGGILASAGKIIQARELTADPPVSECDGRMLWLIVGCITLSSPLLVLLTQVRARSEHHLSGTANHEPDIRLSPYFA